MTEKWNHILGKCDFTDTFERIMRYCEEADRQRASCLRVIDRQAKDLLKAKAENDMLMEEVKCLRMLKKSLERSLGKAVKE